MTVFLGVVSAFSLLSCDKGQSSLVDETSWEGIYDNRVSFRGYVFRQRRGVWRKPLHAFVFFQVPTAQNNQYNKVVHLGIALSATLPSLYTSIIFN